MFEDSLYSFIESLKNETEFDEWYLSDFIDNNVNKLSSSEAYHMASVVIERIEHNICSTELYELVQILAALQRQSKTNEKPIILKVKLNIFSEIIAVRYEDYIIDPLKELMRIYD